MTIRILSTFSSVIRPNTNTLFSPNRTRIEYSVQPYFWPWPLTLTD